MPQKICPLPEKYERAIKKYIECRRSAKLDATTRFPCQEVLADEMSNVGARWVGGGGDRTVYQFSNDCVVKIERGLYSSGSNINEVDSYARLPPSIKKQFLPAGDHDKSEDVWWLTMPLAKVMRESDSKAFGELQGRIRDKGYECWDMHLSNAGFYKGEPVVIDYGATVETPRGGNVCELALPRTRPRLAPRRPGQRLLTMYRRK